MGELGRADVLGSLEWMWGVGELAPCMVRPILTMPIVRVSRATLWTYSDGQIPRACFRGSEWRRMWRWQIVVQSLTTISALPLLNFTPSLITFLRSPSSSHPSSTTCVHHHPADSLSIASLQHLLTDPLFPSDTIPHHVLAGRVPRQLRYHRYALGVE